VRQDERFRQAHADELSWRPGDVLVRREVLNDGSAWAEIAVIVVEDSPELLVTYIPEGAPIRSPPTSHGPHPWLGKERWHGHGTLMLQRPGEWYAVWVFWSGPEREFRGWYLNLQEPFRRTELGYDTQDLELDIWLPREGGVQLKDDHVMEDRVVEGRFTAEQVAFTRAEAARIVEELERDGHWWPDEWAAWEPDAEWPTPRFPC
jgi:hypothetical protein